MSNQGPNSPKKRISCGFTSLDKSGFENIPDFSEVPTQIIVDSDEEDGVVEVEFDSSTSSGEEYVEVIEYESESDEGSSASDTSTGIQEEINHLAKELKPNVSRGRSFKAADDDFEALPPPIEIPNALRPVHMRTPETKPKVAVNIDLSDSSDDSSSDDDSSEDEAPFRPPKSPAIRPSSLTEKKVSPSTYSAKEHDDDSSESSDDDDSSTEAEPKKETVKKPGSSPQSYNPDSTKCKTLPRDHSPKAKVNPPKAVPSAKAKTNSPSTTVKKQAAAPVQKQTNIPKEDKRPQLATTKSQSRFEDDEQKEYGWEKPAWTKTALKSTKKGDTLKSGGYLSMPITELPHIKSNTRTDLKESNEAPSAPVSTAQKKQPVGTNQSISAPGTPKTPVKTFKKPIVSPGKALMGSPVTRDNEGKADFAWEKPSWTSKSLRPTSKGEKLKSGEEIARPIGGVHPID